MVRKLEIDKNPNPVQSENRISKQLTNIPMTEDQKRIVNSVAFNKPLDVKEEKIELSVKERIFEMLKQNDEGVDIDKIIMSINLPVDEINRIVSEMLENAEIYEPKPGRIRLL